MALAFGFDDAGAPVALLARAEAPPVFGPNQWFSIDQAGLVTIRAHKSEMGQGVRTALPAIVAAELGADWPAVIVAHAEPGPAFADMGTSGSSSVSDSWQELRKAAATARAMLVLAGAQRWGVPPTECDTAAGFVVHGPSKRRVAFGALVADAALLPVPQDAPLRALAELPLVGTRLRRVDSRAIVRGTATYGIDVRVPGMRFAVIARPPVAGATPTGWSEAAGLAVPGVERIAQTPQGIAVVASNTWAAIRGRAALAIEWKDPPGVAISSAMLMDRLERALGSGKVARREGDAGAAISGAARRMQAEYRSPFQAHAALEPLT